MKFMDGRMAVFIMLLVVPLVMNMSSECAAEVCKTVWDMKALSKVPKTYPAPECGPQASKAIFYDGLLCTGGLRKLDSGNNRVKSMFYEGLPFKGKPTRVFAYYGLPNVPKGQKVPGIVLVHGGGGSAFESWVRLWNARGYAAIAMDTCGSLPIGEYANWQRHESGGPAGWGGMDQIDWPFEDQWTYHAVADVILAHSFLRSLPEVDPNRIGITGISWGGYLTCIAGSIDKRFKFAVPVYGCGFIMDNSVWLPDFEKMGPEKAAKWGDLWEPSHYLKNSSTPTMWVAGTNDFAYPMDSLLKSYRLLHSTRALCIRVNMPHGHGGAGENPDEILAFADTYCKGAKPMLRIISQGVDINRMWAEYDRKAKLAKVELNYTRDTGKWEDRKWLTVPGEIAGAGKAAASVPEGARECYLNLTDDRGLVVSSEYMELKY